MRHDLLASLVWVTLSLGAPLGEASHAGFLDEAPQPPAPLGGGGPKGDFFDSVGTASTPGSSSPARAQNVPERCHITCGPNRDAYEIHYFCEKREGRLLQNGFLVSFFPHCARGTDITCARTEEKTRVTIFGLPYDRAEARYKGADLGKLECHGE